MMEWYLLKKQQKTVHNFFMAQAFKQKPFGPFPQPAAYVVEWNPR